MTQQPQMAVYLQILCHDLLKVQRFQRLVKHGLHNILQIV